VVRYTLPSRGLSPLKVLPAFPGARGVRLELFELFWRHWRQLARTPEAVMPRAGLLSERRKRELSNGFGAKWFRVIGELEDMIEKSLEIKQCPLFGMGLTRHLAKG